ncbi:FAD-binding protein [Nocardia cyriacigeorgica]|uniref:FAD-binding protein n=1 Tax=Nocardia cyriacigeorgica TaxID=135487 RepID=UPI001893637C|nr:FAD-binding protein [Nocardia cyriacigeorgica]MBF6424477.1 FAD-binding protein [Nocardia cyriacigeorgica]
MSEWETDVLILGGGPAGIWAALSAVAVGARVILADKARCGAAGPTAVGPTSLWHVAPGPARAETVRRALGHGGWLGDPEVLHRVLAEAHARIGQLAERGHGFSGAGQSGRVWLDGAGYLRRLRRAALEAGVRVLDHHPATQLLVDSEGIVSGAAGMQRHNKFRPWTVRAAAVVVATGGCAFGSGRAGTDVDTGDGLLFAVEAGAELSGMEFSSAYGLAPAASVSTVDRALTFATLHDETGAVIEGHRGAAFAALAEGRRVYGIPATLSPGQRRRLRRHGTLDPEKGIPLRAVLEGTVRGTGGLHLTGPDCATTIPGLFAAGDVTTREPLTGAVSGFGSTWAIASGAWSGAGAARFARGRPVPDRLALTPAGAGAGLSPVARIDPRAVIGLVQEHTLPLRRSYRRSAGSLRDSIAELDAMWPGAVFDLGGTGAERLRAREAAAMLAVARWTKYSALARTESRGIHRRTDFPETDGGWRVRLRSGGLDTVSVRKAARNPSHFSPLDRRRHRTAHGIDPGRGEFPLTSG